MAVLLREKIKAAGKVVDVRAFYPLGIVSKKERERALQLEKYLTENVPQIVEKFRKHENIKNKSPVYKWHQFGKELRKICDKSFVSPADIEKGYIWSAIRQHLPESFPLQNAGKVHDKSTKLHGNREHLAVCYALGAYKWEEVKWLQRWDDWCQIYYRMGIGKDKRALRLLASEISELGEYPDRKKYRKITSNMAEKFSQRSGRRIHSDILDDSTIEKWVQDAVRSA